MEIFIYILLFVALFAAVLSHLWVRAGPERASPRSGVRRRLPHRGQSRGASP